MVFRLLTIRKIPYFDWGHCNETAWQREDNIFKDLARDIWRDNYKFYEVSRPNLISHLDELRVLW